MVKNGDVNFSLLIEGCNHNYINVSYCINIPLGDRLVYFNPLGINSTSVLIAGL